jgi:hypothetical protein
VKESGSSLEVPQVQLVEGSQCDLSTYLRPNIGAHSHHGGLDTNRDSPFELSTRSEPMVYPTAVNQQSIALRQRWLIDC